MSDDASAEGRHSKSYGIKLDSNLAAERAVVAVITTDTIDRDREIAVPPGIEGKVEKRLKADPSIMAAAMGD